MEDFITSSAEAATISVTEKLIQEINKKRSLASFFLLYEVVWCVFNLYGAQHMTLIN